MAKRFGQLEVQFFAYIQMRSLSLVRQGDLRSPLGLSEVQERKLLSRMARIGLIARVRRGLYLVPSEIPPGGRWSPGEGLAIKTLIDDKNGRYQICGPNAFNRYGWDEQIPNRTYAYNDKLSGDRKVGTLNLTLIKVARKRLGGTEAVSMRGGVKVLYSSRARSLMDAVYDWSRFNSLPRGYGWIRAEVANDKSIVKELIEVTLRYGNQGTIRRIGCLLEIESISRSMLGRLKSALRKSSSEIPLVPTRPKRGSINSDWGIVVNDDR